MLIKDKYKYIGKFRVSDKNTLMAQIWCNNLYDFEIAIKKLREDLVGYGYDRDLKLTHYSRYKRFLLFFYVRY